VTLAVHPLCGQILHVRSKHGSSRLCVELDSGEERLLPIRWTDHLPRMNPLKIHERVVLLDPSALNELSVWVSSRRSDSDVDRRQGGAHLEGQIAVSENERHDKSEATAAGRTSPVVGEAGSSSAVKRRQ